MLTFFFFKKKRWWSGKDEELSYEADPWHVEKMLNDMELEECKESVVLGTKTAEQEDDNEQLDMESAKRCRSVVVRGIFSAPRST